MKKIIYSIVYALCLFCFTSCEYDNYEAPAETFKGTVIDNTTGKGFQTEVGDGGVRFKMLELSWSNNPTPWYFTCKQDGQFQDTKVFEGNYNITPLGAFVPFVQTDNTGKITKDESLTIDIKGTVTHAASLLADAYVKGVRTFDADKALEAMYHEATNKGTFGPSNGRDGWQDYFKLGYVPYPGYAESVAKTLEFCYDDFCAMPSPESFFRNILLGQDFYKNEFGVKSKDIFLPDCFGFGYALPTIAAHA